METGCSAGKSAATSRLAVRENSFSPGNFKKNENRFAYLYKLSYIYASAVLAMGPRFRFAGRHLSILGPEERKRTP
jgi:hypothetical protein